MAQLTITLKHGLQLEERKQLEAVVRKGDVGDMIDAGLDSEKIVMVDGANGPEPHLVHSPTVLSLHVLRRQVVRIGEIQGPLTLGQMRKLDPEDLAALQEAAATLDLVSIQKAQREVAQRGRDGEDTAAR